MNLEDFELSFLWLMLKDHDEIIRTIKPDNYNYAGIKEHTIRIIEHLHDYEKSFNDLI